LVIWSDADPTVFSHSDSFCEEYIIVLSHLSASAVMSLIDKCLQDISMYKVTVNFLAGGWCNSRESVDFGYVWWNCVRSILVKVLGIFYWNSIGYWTCHACL
jgi:hypothetical protein